MKAQILNFPNCQAQERCEYGTLHASGYFTKDIICQSVREIESISNRIETLERRMKDLEEISLDELSSIQLLPDLSACTSMMSGGFVLAGLAMRALEIAQKLSRRAEATLEYEQGRKR